MRSDCGVLAKISRPRENRERGQGNATSVDCIDGEDTIVQSLIPMKVDEEVGYVDTLRRKLIESHVTQDSRSKSLPNCVDTPQGRGGRSEICDRNSLLSSQYGVNCDPLPFVSEEGTVYTDVKLEMNGPISTDSWFKTWPETRNIVNSHKLTIQNESPHNQSRQQTCDTENGTCEPAAPVTSNSVRPSTVIPLDQLLQSIPLAYSPITRQLHVLSPPAHSEPQQEICRGSKEIEDTAAADEYLGCVPKTGSPFSSLSSLSGAEICGPSTLSNDDDSSDTTSISLVNDAQLNKNLLGAKLKQGSFSNFFTRGLFSWKLSKTENLEDEPTVHSSTGASSSWRLFSRGSQCQAKEDILSLDETCSSASSSCSASNSHTQLNRFPSLRASSGSLILEPRPAHLPAKSQEEEQRHRIQYQQMVQAAKKKEIKEAKLRKKQLQQQLKAEDQLAQATRIWTLDVLPKWDSVKGSRKVRDLWWQGLPPCVRGKVWRLAVGNELNLTPDLYEICVARAQEVLRAAEANSENRQCEESHNFDKESSVELIQLDIARTFPLLCIFQKGGPYYDVLHSLLGAYVCYRPDVGYVQGMSFIAAVLILNLEAPDAFVCFANMLNRPCQRAFFHLDEVVMHVYYAAYNELFQENLPHLYKHFQQQGLTPDLYLLDWLYTMFSRSMPLDVACRVWDVYLRDGEEFLFRTALGILHLNQDTLLGLDFLHGAQFLTKLPDDLSSEALFRSIDGIKMSVGKLKFGDVLNQQIELAKSSEPR